MIQKIPDRLLYHWDVEYICFDLSAIMCYIVLNLYCHLLSQIYWTAQNQDNTGNDRKYVKIPFRSSTLDYQLWQEAPLFHHFKSPIWRVQVHHFSPSLIFNPKRENASQLVCTMHGYMSLKYFYDNGFTCTI